MPEWPQLMSGLEAARLFISSGLTRSMTGDVKICELGDVVLQSGTVLRGAKLAFKTYGALNEARDNAVVLPTFFTGTHIRNEKLFGPGRAIDPARHFIINVNLIGNGYSSSPGNTPAPQDGPRFPGVTIFDNVACQHRLLTEHLGVKRIALVFGWSMAAIQAFHWGAQYPGMVDAVLPYCGAARCSPFCHAFIDGPKAALQADAAWNGGNYTAPPEKGLRAFGRVYAPWAYSQGFFRDKLYQSMGFATQEDFIRDWEEDHLAWDANNLLAKVWTWQHADISANHLYGGDFKKALGAITARAIVMPSDHDLYFPHEDSANEVASMPNAELRVYRSDWGHCVGSPGRVPEFERALDMAAAELLQRV
jgi:homoserine O-acetyltransferase/O-succinyltransferase